MMIKVIILQINKIHFVFSDIFVGIYFLFNILDMRYKIVFGQIF